jgi:hypothetical protein
MFLRLIGSCISLLEAGLNHDLTRLLLMKAVIVYAYIHIQANNLSYKRESNSYGQPCGICPFPMSWIAFALSPLYGRDNAIRTHEHLAPDQARIAICGTSR